MLSVAGCTLGPEPERPSTAADAAPTFSNAEQVRPATQTTAVVGQLRRSGLDRARRARPRAEYRPPDCGRQGARGGGGSAQEQGVAVAPGRLRGSPAAARRSSFVLPDIGRRSIYSTNFNADLGISYQLDLFGKLKRTRQVAWASLLSEQAAQETVQHSVIAGVIRSRVQVATAQRALAIAHDIRMSWERTLETVERRYRSGLVGAVDLHLARENLAAVEGVEIQLEAAVKQAQHALDVLVGRRPGGNPILADTLADLPDLQPVPSGSAGGPPRSPARPDPGRDAAVGRDLRHRRRSGRPLPHPQPDGVRRRRVRFDHRPSRRRLDRLQRCSQSGRPAVHRWLPPRRGLGFASARRCRHCRLCRRRLDSPQGGRGRARRRPGEPQTPGVNPRAPAGGASPPILSPANAISAASRPSSRSSRPSAVCAPPRRR